MAETAQELQAKAAVEAEEVRQADRVMQRHRSEIETGKLVVTFAQAIGATLVGTMLQVSQDGWAVIAPSILLGVGFILAIVTIFTDRLDEPRFSTIDATLPPSHRLVAMSALVRSVAEANEEVVDQATAYVRWSLAVTSLAGAAAVVSLLGGWR